jgi:cobyrinic acid a,c-diamide synthase
MPKMDDGPTDGPPGRELRTVSVRLTPAEAQELLEALVARSEEDYPDPGYHLHITDDEGRELTISVSGDAMIQNRFANPAS